MKLMNREEFEKCTTEMIAELNKEETEYIITVKSNYKREESSGVISFVFSCRKKKMHKGDTPSSIGLYISESKRCINTFIVNGRTMDLLFENSTINSPQIALHYLKDILLSEVKFVKNLDALMQKSMASKIKQKRGNKKFSHNKSRNDRRSSDKNGLEKRPYKKYPDSKKSNDRQGYFNNERPYKSSSSCQIKTTKNSFQKTGGEN